MISQDAPEQQAAARGHVRRNVAPAAIVAVLMCAYGFGRLTRPESDSLFGWCNLILFYTLRVGGVGFGLVAIWSLIGHLPALAVDAVLSVACGVIFMATALGMWVDGGDVLNSALFVVFGWLFTGVGLRNWRLYQHLLQHSGQADDDNFLDGETRESPRNSASSHIDATRHAGHDVNHSITTDPPSDQGDSASTHDNDDPPNDDSNRSDGGFLAGFGRTGAPPGV